MVTTKIQEKYNRIEAPKDVIDQGVIETEERVFWGYDAEEAAAKTRAVELAKSG